MSLGPGTRLGPYEIISAIGAGGMGEVYRARDTNLGRDVAIKILPDAFAQDPERVARFEREAKTLAALNHPNIAIIHGLEKSHGTYALVMELVEGEDLSQRIAQGPIQIDEALAIAKQIAEALEAAHERGIIHRDLKPANIKVRPDGTVKVLDFGLAKLTESTTATTNPSALSMSPTITSPALMTGVGVLLGTAAYMSPEQAKGLTADQRSDVFSFGCVLFEVLTGRQAFQGETVAEVLGAVLVAQPDLNALPSNLNPRLPELVRRCLEKNPKRRWQAVGDLRIEVEVVAAAPRAVAVAPAPVAQSQSWWRRAIPIAVTTVVAGGLTGAAVWSIAAGNFKPSTSPAITRFAFPLGTGQQFTNPGRQLVAISPDGTQIVYVADLHLNLRSMADLQPRPIPGAEDKRGGVLNPVFSPDGGSIAFFSTADQTLKKVAASGGAAVTLCPMDNPPFGMSWGTDGIVFGQGNRGIMRVSASGGKPELLVTVKSGEVAHGPQMLPDQQTVLFTLATGVATGNGANFGIGEWDKAQIVVQSLRSGERKILIEGGSDARYLPTGHLVYAVDGVLFAVPFDVTRLEVTGGPVPIVEGVRRGATDVVQAFITGTAQFSVSESGTLVYVPGPRSTAVRSDLAFIDRKGDVEPLKLPPGSYQFPRISPEGKRIAFGTDDGKEAIIWIYDLTGTSNSMRRLTFGGKNRFPVWSADGKRVAFQSDREGDLGIFWQPADGSGTAERLTKPDQGTSHAPYAWSPKGESFLFGVTKESSVSLWTFSLQDKKATPFGAVQSSFPIMAVFSPDGRWVAYASNETGGLEVYVQPFPSTGAKYQVSKNRSSYHPVWSSDGKELVYRPLAGQMAAVSVSTEPSLTFGNPVPFTRPFVNFGASFPRNYDITPDGKQFIGVVDAGPSGEAAVPQIQVVLNWFEELKRLVPTK